MNSKGKFIGGVCLSVFLLLLANAAALGGHNHSKIAYSFFDTQIPLQISETTRGSHEILPGTKGVGDPVDMDAALIVGANYLKHAQADVTEDNAGNGDPDADPEDGGWDWRLTAPNFVHSASSSPTNIYGATAQGLYRAYLETADASYMTAIQDAATYMIGNANIRSAADLIFLMLFQDLSGVTPDIYSDAAKAKFDARITTYGSATALAEYIRDVRQSQGYENGIIPWDIGAWVVAAQMLEDRYPSDPYDYAQAADDMAEVIYQDSYEQNPGYFDLTTDKNNGWDPTYSNYDYYWYTLGITGILDAFAAASVHTDKIASLLAILLDCQYSGGAFSYCYGANTDDEDWQSTAYSVLSLARVDQTTYQTNINHACYWLGATQDAASGGWVYSSGNHYPEIGGECTAALYFGQNATEVWVDDDYTEGGYNDGHMWGYDAFATIQDGIDGVSGSTVNVAAGTYEEQIYIGKSLDLVGAGIGNSIIEAVPTGSRTTYSVTQWTGSSRTVDACLGVKNAGTVNISGFTIDGKELGPDNFYGVHYFNTSGSVTGCRVEDITDAAHPSYSRIVSLLATHGLGETFTVEFSDNVVPNFQKGGVVVMGPGASFTVDGNRVTGVVSSSIAGNCIQLSYGSSGSTYGNYVEGTTYTGSDWASTGILLFESGDISMVQDTAYDCEMGVNFSDWGWVHVHPLPVNLDMEKLDLQNNQWGMVAQLSRDNSDLNLTLNECDFLNGDYDGVDLWGTGPDPWGGSYYTGWDNGDLDVTITDCYFDGNVYDGIWDLDESGNANNAAVDVCNCGFVGNGNSAINHGFTQTLDASGCYWNDVGGPTIGVKSGALAGAVVSVSPFGVELPEVAGISVSKTLIGSHKGGETIYGSIDYTPWLGAGTTTGPGFDGDFSTLYVDDDSPQTQTTGRIQEGVDMVTASTVEVGAGTYVEQVHITKDDLILVGSGADNTTIKSPATLTHYFTTGSNNNYPVVFVDEATGVAISDLTIDGDHQGNANYRFVGLGFWNGDGSLTDAKVLNIMDNPFSGAQHGVGIYSYNDDGGPYTIAQNNVLVDDFQKNAVALLGAGLTVDIDDVTTTGEGPTSVTAQNGIQIGPGVGGTVDNCSISGVAYTGATWTATGFLNWGSITATGLEIDQCQTGVYWMDGSGTFTGGTIANPIGDGFYAYNSTAKGTKQLRVSPQPYDETVAPSSKAPMSVTLSNTAITGTGAADSWGVGAFSTSTDPVNLTVTGCLITNWDYGVYAYDYGGPVNCYVHWNSIFGNSSYGLYNGTGTTVDAEYNSWGSVDGPEDLTGSDEAQLDECYDVSTMVNAVAELSGSLGNGASENADYCPWLGGDAGFDTEIYAGCNDPCDDFCLDFKLTGIDIRFFHFEYPLPTCIVKTTVSAVHPDLVTFQATMFGNVLHIDGNFDPNFTGTNIKLGEVCFSHDGTCPNTIQTLTCTADDVRDGAGNLVDVTPGPAVINVDNTAPTKDHPTGDILPCYSASDDPDWSCWNLSFYKGTEEWQCDLLQATIRIYSAPGCNSGDLVFTHHFFTATIPGDFNICYPTNQAERDAIWAALSSDGTYYVRLTVSDDCCNEADNCDAFTFCKDTYTDNYFTCVDARPAHNHICLQWDYTSDPVEAVQCRILRSPYRAGNYPEYAASDPVPTGHDDPNWYVMHEGTDTYPCTGGSWYDDDGAGCNGGGTFFDNSTRDIYWYAGFTKDAAGNWSAANMTLGTGADRMTSYWLGDVADISGLFGPDGQVFGFTGDVGRLTSAYGTIPGSPFWDNTVDYGPESEDHGIGRGIPQPDDVINYLDLKPFSFNYNIVGPSGDCGTWPLLHNDPPRNLKARIQDVAVWLEQVPSTSPHKDLTFAVMLKNPDDATHLFHATISFNTNVLSLVEVRRGEVGIIQAHDEFFAAPVTGDGILDVDLAGLGPDAYLEGSGAVAYLDFVVRSAGASSEVWLKEVVLFDGEGNEIPLISQSVEIDGFGKSRPTDFALYQNHPNPFNPTTTVKYDLPQTCNVKLVVYNLRGQRVATLVDGVVEAGRHQVTWNADELSSGIYFYKLVADNFTKMCKMMLLK